MSLFSIHAQVEPDTISGSSQGTRNIPRSRPDSRKLFLKNTASARPMLYWKTIDTMVKITVLRTAGQNVALAITSA